MFTDGVIPKDYSLDIDQDGILAEDGATAGEDIVARVRMVLDLVWPNAGEAVNDYVCASLKVRSLRDYFRDPHGFLEYHIKRYSKSRRKAPIYWLLQSPRRSYGLWLYYHRLDRDTLYKALTLYAEPKLRLEEDKLRAIEERKDALPTAAQGRRQLEREAERQAAIVADIREFRDRLERAASLNLVPDLDDGVILNMAPLWELVPWAEPKRYWDELLAGKYEWSAIGRQLRQRGLVGATARRPRG
jgi:hypothetical protein